jgi:hypothetical protein
MNYMSQTHDMGVWRHLRMSSSQWRLLAECVSQLLLLGLHDPIAAKKQTLLHGSLGIVSAVILLLI